LPQQLLQDQILISLLAKHSENLRNRNACSPKPPQNPAFAFYTSGTILPIPIGVAMSSSLLDDNQSNWKHRQIKRFKDTSLSALCKSFAYQVFKTNGTAGFSGTHPLVAPKRIFRPVRHRAPRATPVQVPLSFGV
jgi:hypothetical protein